MTARSPFPHGTPRRDDLVTAVGLTAAAAAVAAVLGARARREVTDAPQSGAVTGVKPALPASRILNLGETFQPLFREGRPQETTALRSFAFDDTNRRLFTAQPAAGADAASGDLCITRLDLSGNPVGHMNLTGFGRGGAFAAEGEGTDTWLWIETDADGAGYGTRLTRLRFAAGETVDHADRGLPKYLPAPDASRLGCTIDQVHRTMAVPYHWEGRPRIVVFPLSDVTHGDFGNPLAEFPQPTELPDAELLGCALDGGYLYVLDMAAGHARITTVDLRSGQQARQTRLDVDTSGTPTGLAVHRPTDAEARLFLGAATGKEGGHGAELWFTRLAG
jgi:hypothetical protein